VEVATRLDRIRQGMPVVEASGVLVGHSREVSGRSLLILEADSPRVFWIDGDAVGEVADGVIRLRSGFRPPVLSGE
jgi:hypothetical protein